MKKSSLTPHDRQFLIKLSKAVDAIKAHQKTTDTRLTTNEHNIQAAHTRLNKLEAQINQPAMTAEFTGLMPGFTKHEAQTKFFFHALKKLLKEFNVRALEGRIDA